MRIKLRQRASVPQAEFVNAPEEFPAFVGGFGSGKTAAGVMRALRLKFQNPRQDVGYYLPTYDLVSRIGYPRFSESLANARVKFSLNKQEHVLTIKGKGCVIFRTLDNPDRIVGYEVADSIVDELDTLKSADAERCWQQIIARNRQKKPGGAPNTVGVATTPEGFRFVYDRWEKTPAEGYRLIRAATHTNARNLPAGYIDSLRRTYPPQLIDAYIEGRFVNLTSGAVYPDFSRELNSTNETIADGEELHVGVDFNVYNCTVVLCVIRFGVPRVLGELTKLRDTPHVVQTLVEKFPHHRINIYPDASGQSNKTVNATESDIKILRDAGFAVHVPTRNPFVKERVMAVNGLICNALGVRTLLINPQLAPTVTECLEQQIYDTNGEPDKKDGKDHAPDALGYFVHYRWPIVKPASSDGLLQFYASQQPKKTE
ncbi:MAG: terminase family protein [Patescibacteria group bacterium]|nr:terminase family protein [Patescibacteria group bacterium]